MVTRERVEPKPLKREGTPRGEEGVGQRQKFGYADVVPSVAPRKIILL